MSWLDLFIIYIACGTPFAVYRLVLSDAEPADTAARSILAALLWPYDGGKSTVKRLLHASRTLSKPRVNVIRSEIEAILANDDPHLPRFRFREDYDRYACLAAASNSRANIGSRHLLEIAGYPLTRASEECLLRISRTKV